MTKDIAEHVVMIVEDDLGVREAICEVVEDGGYCPVVAGNGREALEQLQRRGDKPCIILLDIMMPIMDGREFRSAQQADPSIADIPVVVLSAPANVTETAREMNVADALKKPLQLESLLEVIGRYCKPN